MLPAIVASTLHPWGKSPAGKGVTFADCVRKKASTSPAAREKRLVNGVINQPKRVGVLTKGAAGSAIVIDSLGHTSDQIDVVIYDQQFTPVLLDQQHHKYVPAEAVYAVLEVKPTINRDYLQYAGRKAASVRQLHRTSCPIPHAGGTYPAKPPFPITAGLIAAKIDWADGFGATFLANHAELKGNESLDCGLALAGGAFDLFAGSGKFTYGPPKHALIYFLFRLLQRLQSLGSVPAIDWNSYAAHLSEPSPTKASHV